VVVAEAVPTVGVPDEEDAVFCASSWLTIALRSAVAVGRCDGMFRVLKSGGSCSNAGGDSGSSAARALHQIAGIHCPCV
jgi:hypothetical protein